MENQVPQKILDRIKALLRKADPSSNDSQAEMETAAAMAQKLMLEYNLSRVDLTGQNSKLSEIIERSFDPSDILPKNEGRWRITLYHAVFKANLCKFWTINSGTLGANVIGEPHNLEIAFFTLESLVQRIIEMGKAHYKSYSGPEKRNAYLRGFYLGCAIGLREKLNSSLNKVKETSNPTSALVIQKEQAIEKWVEERGMKFGAGRAAKTSAASGYHSGLAAGRSMSIQKGVGGSSSNSRLLN